MVQQSQVSSLQRCPQYRGTDCIARVASGFLWCVVQKVYRVSCLTLVQLSRGCIPYIYLTEDKQKTHQKTRLL